MRCALCNYAAMTNPFSRFREAKNLTITEAAARCGVNKSTYLRWESGATKVDITNLSRVSKATGISRKRLRPDIFDAAVTSGNAA